MPTSALTGYIERVTAMLEQIPQDSVVELVEQLKRLQGETASLYVLGNGGSECLAQHLVLHLRQRGIRAFDLMADPAWLTAMSNDFTYQTAAMSLLDVLYKEGDMLLVISGSGNSENVKAAVRLISAVGGQCVGILGNGGGRVLQYCTHAVVLPGPEHGPLIIFPGFLYEPLEDCFSAIIHMLSEGLR